MLQSWREQKGYYYHGRNAGEKSADFSRFATVVIHKSFIKYKLVKHAINIEIKLSALKSFIKYKIANIFNKQNKK